MWVVHNLQDNEHVIIIHVQDGQTALYIASWKGHMEVVKLLLQKQSDVGISKTVYYNTLYTFLYYCVQLHITHHVGTPSTPAYVPVQWRSQGMLYGRAPGA